MIQVYFLTLIEIKRNSSICNGAVNLFHEIERARKQDEEVFEADKFPFKEMVISVIRKIFY